MSTHEMACHQCLRSVVCLCTLRSRLEYVRSAVWACTPSTPPPAPTTLAAKWCYVVPCYGWIGYVLLRTLGYVSWPIVECAMVAVALIDLAPLSRRELAVEAALLALVLKTLPVIGWRISLLSANVLTGALMVHCLLGSSCALGRVGRGDVCTAVVLTCCALMHMPADDGVGFASALSAYFVSLVAVWWTDSSDETNASTSGMKFIRAIGLSTLAQRTVLNTGFVFAFRLTSHDKPLPPSPEGEASLDDVDEEFDSFPQHLAAVALVATVHVLYLWSNVPVALLVAIGVAVHAMTVAWCDAGRDGTPTDVSVVHLRTRYNVALLTSLPLMRQTAAFVAQRIDLLRPPTLCLPTPPIKPLAATLTCLLWLTVCGGFVWFVVAPSAGAVGIGTLNVAVLSWSIVVALSNKHFSGGFVFSVVVASSLAFSMVSVFHASFLDASLLSSALTTAPLFFCAVTLYLSNQTIIWRPEAARIVASTHATHGPHRRPMQGQQNPKFRRRR